MAATSTTPLVAPTQRQQPRVYGAVPLRPKPVTVETGLSLHPLAIAMQVAHAVQAGQQETLLEAVHDAGNGRWTPCVDREQFVTDWFTSIEPVDECAVVQLRDLAVAVQASATRGTRNAVADRIYRLMDYFMGVLTHHLGVPAGSVYLARQRMRVRFKPECAFAAAGTPKNWATSALLEFMRLVPSTLEERVLTFYSLVVDPLDLGRRLGTRLKGAMKRWGGSDGDNDDDDDDTANDLEDISFGEEEDDATEGLVQSLVSIVHRRAAAQLTPRTPRTPRAATPRSVVITHAQGTQEGGND